MSGTLAQLFPDWLPIVLVGGRSLRFGRDKLLESLTIALGTPNFGQGEFLVDRPIAALRAVFGPRITLVGQCDAAVAARADAHLADPRDGCGPLGGIVTALRSIANTDHAGIFVLAGDLPLIDSATIRAILAAAKGLPYALAVLGHSGHLEPCIGLYRSAAMVPLAAHLESGRHALHDALDPALIHAVAVPPRLCLNINRLADLSRLKPLSPS